MTVCSFEGDLQLNNTDGDWDFTFTNGQPCLTNGFDSAVLLSIFMNPDTWQNGLTNDPSEKFISTFPSLIKQATVSDTTIKNGIQSLKRALQWMITDSIAQSIDVSGGALSVYGLYWEIDINRGNIDNRYKINWQKGILEIQKEAA